MLFLLDAKSGFEKSSLLSSAPLPIGCIITVAASRTNATGIEGHSVCQKKKDNMFSPAFVSGPSYRIVLIGGLVANGKIETLTSNSILVIRVKEGSQSRTFNGRCLKIHGPFTYLICQNIRSGDCSLAYSYVITKFDTQVSESSALR